MSWPAFKRFRKALRNAMKCFRPGEIDYRMETGEFDGFVIAYRKGTVDERVIDHSFGKDIFFSRVPEITPAQDDGVVIDIGAHIGTFALLAATKVPNGVVHAIEASRETYNYLRVNCALNPDLRIVPHHLALSGKTEPLELYHDTGGSWGHSITKRLSAVSERVQGVSLDDFLKANAIQSVSCMKFNCEGAEFPILMNASLESLRRITSILVLYHLHLIQGYTLDDLVLRLKSAGFGVQLKNQSGDKGWIVAVR